VRARSLTDFGNSINLLELGRSRLSWQNLAEFGQSVGLYLLSVLPRHSYCNWASPVIVPSPLAEGPKTIQFGREFIFIISYIFLRWVAV